MTVVARVKVLVFKSEHLVLLLCENKKNVTVCVASRYYPMSKQTVVVTRPNENIHWRFFGHKVTECRLTHNMWYC